MIKQIRAYSVAPETMPTPEQLIAVASAYPARECQYQEKEVFGFRVFPGYEGRSDMEVWVLCRDRFAYLEIVRYHRNVPENLLKREVEKKVKEVTQSTGQAPEKGEIKALRDEIWITLLPRMPQTETIIPVIFDYQLAQLWLASASEGLAESIRALFRRGGLSLAASPLFHQIDVGATLANWLLGRADLPKGLSLGSKTRAVDPHNTRATIAINNEELDDDMLQEVLKPRAVIQLELLTDQVSFLLLHDGAFKSIKLNDPEEAIEDRQQLLSYYTLELAQTLALVANDMGAPIESE